MNVIKNLVQLLYAQYLHHRNQIDLLVLFLLNLFIIVFLSPLYRIVPYRDSGVFLYAGSVIIDGGLPYSDIWDHKGPLIYYINAYGELIWDNSWYGVICIEFIFISAAILISYFCLKKAWGSNAAFFGTLGWVATLPLTLEGGNLPEEYALPFLFGSIYLFYLSYSENKPIYYPLIGLLGGILFILKPSLITIDMAIILYSWYLSFNSKQWKNTLLSSLFFVIGFIIPLITSILYFYVHNVFVEYIDQFLFYNLVYSQDHPDKIYHISNFAISNTQLFHASVIVAILSIVTISVYFIHNFKNNLKIHPLIGVALLMIPFEFVIITLTSRFYYHYLIPLSIAIAIFFGFFMSRLLSAKSPVFPDTRKRVLVALIITVLLLGIGSTSIFSQFQVYSGLNEQNREILQYIEINSNDTDPLLFWGAEASLNYISQRNSPTKYVYQYPLANTNYRTKLMIEEYTGELEQEPPLFIIDTLNVQSIFPLNEISDLKFENNQSYPEEITILRYYFHDHYEKIGIFNNSWVIYKYCC